MRPNYEAKLQQMLRPNEALGLKAMFAAHFAIVVWLLEMGREDENKRWLLVFSNAFLFITFFWAILDRRCTNPIQLAVFIEAVCITIDARVVYRMYALEWPFYLPYKFSAWVISLGLRSITLVLLCKICKDRFCNIVIKQADTEVKRVRRESASRTAAATDHNHPAEIEQLKETV